MSAARQVYNLKVDPSGRIVLPAQTRERLHISGGDTVVIVEDESGVHLKNAEPATCGGASILCYARPARRIAFRGDSSGSPL